MTTTVTNIEPGLPRWLRSSSEWLQMPAGAGAAQRRWVTLARLGYPAGVYGHVTYLVLSAWWGVGPLALFNVWSVAVWLLAMLWARRHGVSSPGVFWLLCANAAAHAMLVWVFVGWGFGAQYILIHYVVTLGMASATIRPRSRTIGTAMLTALFIGGYYYTEATEPLYQVPAVPLAVVNILNIAYVFAMLAALLQYSAAVADSAEDALAAEHARSERLLANVLPVPIAARLKDREEVIADGVDGASVLFADIVGFTVLSSQRTPDEVVAMLNGVFTRLDALVDEFGLEKIKTIGDAYMVASGIPVPRKDHAQVLAHFALAARNQLAEHNLTADVPVELRIGINSGPVVAGVIGRRRFLYDLWGDTVNTASRMESHGLPGQIQITETTRALLDGEFTCTERGVIDVKGKGPTRTWLLESESDPVPVIP